MSNWTQSESERREKAERGETVLANIKADATLIEWAKEKGIYVFIGRPSSWKNPFVIGEDGDRKTCIASFKTYFSLRVGLHKKLTSLKGKVLGCYCYPEPCHGHELIKLVNGKTNEHDARRGLRCSGSNRT